MNRLKHTIAALIFAVALFGAAGASAGPYYYYGYGAYVPGYGYGYWYQPYSYAPVVEYYAPRQCWPGAWSGYWRAC